MVEDKITNSDISNLVLMLRSEGFSVMQKIMRQKCEDYKTVLMNSDPADHAAVLAAHVMAKSAAQFYESVAQDINEMVAMYQVAHTQQAPQDMTEGALDIDNGHQKFEEYQEEQF